MNISNIVMKHSLHLVIEGVVVELRAGEIYSLPNDIADTLIGTGRASIDQSGGRSCDLPKSVDAAATARLPKPRSSNSTPNNPFVDVAYGRKSA